MPNLVCFNESFIICAGSSINGDIPDKSNMFIINKVPMFKRDLTSYLTYA